MLDCVHKCFFYVSVKLGHIWNTVIERPGEILSWQQRLVEIVSNWQATPDGHADWHEDYIRGPKYELFKI